MGECCATEKRRDATCAGTLFVVVDRRHEVRRFTEMMRVRGHDAPSVFAEQWVHMFARDVHAVCTRVAVHEATPSLTPTCVTYVAEGDEHPTRSTIWSHHADDARRCGVRAQTLAHLAHRVYGLAAAGSYVFASTAGLGICSVHTRTGLVAYVGAHGSMADTLHAIDDWTLITLEKAQRACVVLTLVSGRRLCATIATAPMWRNGSRDLLRLVLDYATRAPW